MREWLPADHSVWALIGIVEGLDTSAFHHQRRTGGVGRAGYDPDMLVTLLIWAWSQGVRSSRRIERACADVVSYRVICAGDGPDHVTIARFRAENHAACEQLFTEVLMLAAGLGLGRLETVALDGVKIASNASLSANRTTSGLAKAAAAEAARIAKAAAAAHEATDAAEDEMFGDDNPGSVPAELTDPAVLAKRIAEALARRNAEDTAQGPAADDGAPAAGSVELERVAHDRSGRIAQAPAPIHPQNRPPNAPKRNPLGGQVSGAHRGRGEDDRPDPGRRPGGDGRAGAGRGGGQVAGQTPELGRSGAVGARTSGAAHPAPRRAERPGFRQARARLERARGGAGGCRPGRHQRRRTANLTDPQSRIQPLRGGGWLQGYNCQAVTAADGLIVATGVGTSPVDNQYYTDMIDKAIKSADLITGHRRDDTSTTATASSIAMVLADAGYCTNENLTAPGPDRLIATGKARDVHHAATEHPTQGPPPTDADPIAAMAHRLRTPQGIIQYAMRSHIAETPFGHAKHNLGFRRFTGRGLARARSEWTFHAAVHNIGKILNHLASTPLPA